MLFNTLHSAVNQKTSTPKRMALFQYYQIVAKYYLKTLPRSLKVATLAADNARLSIILIQSLFLIKERYFHFFRFPLRFKLSFKLYVFYFYRIFHILSFLFLRTLTITFRHMKKWHNLSQDYKAYLFSLIRRYNRCINFY